MFAATLVAMAEPALALHVDGTAPATLFQGLLAGLREPVLGVDHFAAVVAAGFVAAFICLCALAAAGNFAEPVPAGHFYPISRARLGRVAYFNSLVKVGALVAVVLGLAAEAEA